MPSPQSSRANLDKARKEGRVKFWRSHSESQRVKAEIAWLHHTKPELSQRVIARILHVSQPYVARLLKRVRLSPRLENALGDEAYGHYRQLLEGQRRAYFQAQGGPASLIGESASESGLALEALQSTATIATAAKAEALGTEYVELGLSTSGEVIEIHGSLPSWAPVPSAPAQRYQEAGNTWSFVGCASAVRQ